MKNGCWTTKKEREATMQLCHDKSIMKKTFLVLLATAALLACGRSSPAKDEQSSDLQDKTDGSCLHINDSALYQSFLQELTRLFKNGKTTEMSTLERQLGRDHASVELPKITTEEMTFPELYRKCTSGVLIVGYLYTCEKCGQRHVGIATGFVLTASGAIATAYHVVNGPPSEALGAMTSDGKVYAVKEVIAASRIDDVAILQLEGSGFQALAISASAPVGASVAMIGHPDRQFYMMTTGTISRYYIQKNEGIETLRMSATAEIGGGASGGPLLNASGAVVGMASKTLSFLGPAHDNDHRVVQMVIKQYVPASVILDLLTSDSGSAMEQPDSPRRFITRMEALARSGSWDTLENEAGIWITEHPSELYTPIVVAGRLMTKPGREGRRVGERILRRVLATDPNSIDGLRVLSRLLYSQKRYPEAVELYRRWLTLAPNEVMVLNDLAWTLSEEMGQYEEALELAEKALKLAPENMTLLDTYAVICWHLKRYDEAETSLKEALRACRKAGSATRRSIVFSFHLAEVYWESGRKEEAGSLFQECLGLQEKTGGLSPEQMAQAKRRCKELAIGY
jgi:serine protease Do